MAAAGKKKLKFDIAIDITKDKDLDFQKESMRVINSNAEIRSLIKPMKFPVEAELDPDEWNKKKLEEALYGTIQGQVKILDMRIKQFEKHKDVKRIKDEIKEFESNCKVGVKKRTEEIVSGKADSEKALKEGKDAMNQIKTLKGNSFDGPRKEAIEALKPLTNDKNTDASAGEKANKALMKTKATLDKTGKAAQKAITFLLTSAKKMKGDKKAEKSLKEFGEDVLKKEGLFDDFLAAADEFGEAFDEAIRATKENEMDAGKARDLTKTFEELNSMNRKAEAAIEYAKELEPKFKKIQNSFK